MASVLGISAYYHDAACALARDGIIVAAVQEERLSRVKNDPRLPVRAAHACLALAGMDAGQLDAVVFYEDPFAKLERVLVGSLRAFPRGLRQFPRALGSQLGDKIWILDRIAEALDIPRDRVEFVSHHRSHAASAFFPSPFERAAVLVADAVGEHDSTTLWRGDGDRLECLEAIRYPHSLGLFYAAITAYLGFAVNEGEYKVMGLAAHGSPRFADEFARLVDVDADGGFALGLEYFAHMSDSKLGFGPRLETLLGERRPPGRPWDLSGDDDRRYADIAATAQRVTEDALLSWVRRARRTTGCSALCLAGGVALNAVANGRILAEAGFDRVFVQPAAGDAGGALGAAILGALALGDSRPSAMTSVALGEPVSAARAQDIAESLGLGCRRVADPPADIARRIAAGQIVAVATGRFEWGPRALGQRSILADPGPPEVRDRINRVVKDREPFRPFAPAVLADHAAAWFGDAPSDMTPFMTAVCPVLPDRRPRLGAVTHVDGSARVQTVTTAAAPALFAILTEVARQTDVPVVLNTSLNGRGDPLVASAADALGFFVQSPVDALFVEDLAITRGAR